MRLMLCRALPRACAATRHSATTRRGVVAGGGGFRRRLATDSSDASAAPLPVVKIELEPLTAEAFAPFGEICGTLAGGEPSLCVCHC